MASDWLPEQYGYGGRAVGHQEEGLNVDYAVTFGPLFTGASDAFTDILPLAIPVALLFVGLGIAIAVSRKFGIKTR